MFTRRVPAVCGSRPHAFVGSMAQAVRPAGRRHFADTARALPRTSDLALLPASEQYTVRQDDAHAAVGLQAGEHMLSESQISIAARGNTVAEAAIWVADLFVVGRLGLLLALARLLGLGGGPAAKLVPCPCAATRNILESSQTTKIFQSAHTRRFRAETEARRSPKPETSPSAAVREKEATSGLRCEALSLSRRALLSFQERNAPAAF